MAGAACKVIINQLTTGLSMGLEKALTMPLVREKLGEGRSDALLDRLVHVDLAGYDGTWPKDSLSAILSDLVDSGVVTDEVWRLLKKPG